MKDGALKHGISLDSLHNLLNSYQNKAIEDKKHLLKKKRDKFKRNIGSKIFSFIFGIFLWMAIINSQNPLTTQDFIVPVEVRNEKALSEVGKTYEIESGEIVSVSVTAPRNVIDGMKTDDIKAYADFNKLSYTYSVPIEAKISGVKARECTVNTKNATMQLKLDEMMERTFDLQIETNGTCKNGYWLTEIDCNTKQISIQGSESQVKVIDKAVAKISLYGKDESFSITKQVEIYDKNGSQLNNDDFIISIDEVIVNAIILPSKKIPVKINLQNENSDDYKLLSMEVDLDTISIAGEKETLDSIHEIIINVDMGEDQISENLIKTINLSDYFPEGIFSADNNKRINISMKYEVYVTKDFEIDVNKINVLNLEEDLICEFNNEKFTLTFKIEKEKLNDFNINDLKFYLNVEELNKGNYNLPIQIQNLPNGVTLTSDGIIPFNIENDKK